MREAGSNFNQFGARYQAIDLCRFVASCLIVFIHFVLPGTTGLIIRAVARLGVPFFFAVSGFFSVGIGRERLRQRIIRLMGIQLLASLIYLLWKLTQHDWSLGDISKRVVVKQMANWLLMGQNPFSGHLWYLQAMLVIYIIIYIFILTCGKNETTSSENQLQPLYPIGVSALLITIFLDVKALGVGQPVDFHAYRNGLFMGLPMFLLGYGVRYKSKDFAPPINPHTKQGQIHLVIIFMIGLVLSVLQELGLGKSEMPIGAVISAFSLLVLAGVSLRQRFNALRYLPLADASLYIYILHPLVGHWLGVYSRIIGLSLTQWSFPLVTMFISIGIGLLASYTKRIIVSLSQ